MTSPAWLLSSAAQFHVLACSQRNLRYYAKYTDKQLGNVEDIHKSDRPHCQWFDKLLLSILGCILTYSMFFKKEHSKETYIFLRPRYPVTRTHLRQRKMESCNTLNCSNKIIFGNGLFCHTKWVVKRRCHRDLEFRMVHLLEPAPQTQTAPAHLQTTWTAYFDGQGTQILPCGRGYRLARGLIALYPTLTGDTADTTYHPILLVSVKSNLPPHPWRVWSRRMVKRFWLSPMSQRRAGTGTTPNLKTRQVKARQFLFHWKESMFSRQFSFHWKENMFSRQFLFRWKESMFSRQFLFHWKENMFSRQFLFHWKENISYSIERRTCSQDSSCSFERRTCSQDSLVPLKGEQVLKTVLIQFKREHVLKTVLIPFKGEYGSHAQMRNKNVYVQKDFTI